MKLFKDIAMAADDIYLPQADTDLTKWAVVACDQYTSQPEYWDETTKIVGDAPSTLRLIYPEAWLPFEEARISSINDTMRRYIADGVIAPAVHGFILTERQTGTGTRLGLVVTVDLEQYDYTASSTSPIRATEGTVIERLPPRVAIRRGATLDLPHIMMLIDDRGKRVIEPLYAARKELRPVYDIELMQGGGRIRGWAVEGEALDGAVSALRALKAASSSIFMAVGDGNHSLAAAKQCWEAQKAQLSPDEWDGAPARYALCELVNLHEDALIFEPIHRFVRGLSAQALTDRLVEWSKRSGITLSRGSGAGQHFTIIDGDAEIALTASGGVSPTDVGTIQRFLDELTNQIRCVTVDYIHGEDALHGLAGEPNCCGILLEPMDKGELFPAVERGGALPRKTFSMGEASDKRYYLESRRLG